jgi:hypothetical protein
MRWVMCRWPLAGVLNLGLKKIKAKGNVKCAGRRPAVRKRRREERKRGESQGSAIVLWRYVGAG